MRPSISPPSGPGPRRPGQPTSTITPRRRWPMSELRTLPFRDTDRLEVLDYRLTAPTPNGSRTYCYASLLLAGQFGFEAQITRDPAGFWLELPLLADDRVLRRAVEMEFQPLLGTLWRRLEQRHIREQARQSRRGYGRN